MIYSNKRKLTLSGWLSETNRSAYESPLKLQKFLFFYEIYSKIDNEKADFKSLKGYKRGPVFSNVWGDYTKERVQFDIKADETYKNNKEIINIDRAKQCSFLVSILSELELSSLTHELNIWHSKKQQIDAGKRQVSLCESDFNDDDIKIVKALQELYPIEFVKKYSVYQVGIYSFLIDNKDIEKLTNHHYDVIHLLSQSKNLQNPVFVKLENGRLIID